MKRKWIIIMGVVLGITASISGCEKKAQKTIGETVKAEEGKEEIEEIIKEDTPEIFYDFEGTEVINLGSKQMEQALLVNNAYCTKNEAGEGVLMLSGGKDDETSPYLSMPAGTFDNVSEMTIVANVLLNDSKKDYNLFLIKSSYAPYFAISLSSNSITTAFYAVDKAKEKIETAQFAEDRTGQWIHVAVTIRNSAEDYIADTYIDGKLVSSFSFDGYALVDIGKEQECTIGKSQGNFSYFNGYIANFYAWFHAKSAEEIKELYHNSNI